MARIRGTVESIIFQNSENWYTVLDLDCDGKLTTAVGTFPPVSEGEELIMEGEFVQNKKYGEQFAATDVRAVAPESKDGIARYLSGGQFKGIGPVTAAKITEKFGASTLKILETQPERLSEVSGITKKKAAEIGETYKKVKFMRDAILFLKKYSVSTGLALKIFNAYGQETEKVVTNNPYAMVEDIDGVGFLTADKIAGSIGIRADSEFRIRAGIAYVLKEASKRYGHTYLPADELKAETVRLLNLDDVRKYTEALDAMTISGSVIQTDDGIAPSNLYYLEKNIASKLVKLLHESEEIHLDIDAEIREFERLNNLSLHEYQRLAVEKAVSAGVCVITGGPGTGKTTITKCIINILRARNMSVSLCAPTGRAAKRMHEATGVETKTIHRMLNLQNRGGKTFFGFNENSELPSSVVIVDEASMVDVFIFNALLRALKRGAKLILIGDKDQLPAVGAGNVLKDIIESELVPVICLQYIYRQESDSLIVENAHRINKGLMPILDVKDKDFFFSKQSDATEILKTVKDMVLYRLPKFTKLEPRDIQVLAPLKKGVAGVNNLNRELQNIVNPQKGGKEYRMGDQVLRKGDKVMQTVNNYDLEWTRADDDDNVEYGTGVFNGDLGIVDQVTSNGVNVLFDDGRYCEYDESVIDSLSLAYAISVHKSQGCEFDAVVMVCFGGMPMIMTRNLLYTAITRAKKWVLLIGNPASVARMVHNNFTETRYSKLKSLILDENRKYERAFSV